MSAPEELRPRANGLVHRALAWGPRDAPAIVLAHGFLDQAWSFRAVAERLAAAGRRAIAFDWRGHGETDWIGPGGYYHFPDYALDLQELLPAIAGESFDLVGHSMGGTASAVWAGTRPAGLRTLTLCEGLGPPEVPPEALPDRARAWLSSVSRARAAAPRPMRDLDEATERLRAQHAEGDLAPDLARFLADKGTRPVEGGLAWRFDPLHRSTAPIPFSRPGFVALLARIAAPVLVVSGERGFRTSDHADRVAAIPDVREIVIPGAGHMMHWHAPEALADAILEHTSRPR